MVRAEVLIICYFREEGDSREMWADTILILVISVCTALLGEVRERQREILLVL